MRHPRPRRPPRPPRLPRTTALLVAALLVAPSAAVGATLAAERAAVLRPTLDAPFPTGAVMVLGGFPERLAWTSAELPDAGVGRVLVVSANAALDFATSGGDCDAPQVRCVVPDPYTTRGEALVAAELVAAEGWDRLTVVTSVWHARRVRLLFEGCLDVPLAVVGIGDPADVPVGRLPRELAGGLEARLRPACPSGPSGRPPS